MMPALQKQPPFSVGAALRLVPPLQHSVSSNCSLGQEVWQQQRREWTGSSPRRERAPSRPVIRYFDTCDGVTEVWEAIIDFFGAVQTQHMILCSSASGLFQ